MLETLSSPLHAWHLLFRCFLANCCLAGLKFWGFFLTGIRLTSSAFADAPSEGPPPIDAELLEAWYLDGIDLLLHHLPDQGERAAEAIRDNLTEIDA